MKIYLPVAFKSSFGLVSSLCFFLSEDITNKMQKDSKQCCKKLTQQRRQQKIKKYTKVEEEEGTLC